MTYNITLTANHQSLTTKYLPLAAESVQYLTAKVVYETDDWTGREIKAMFEHGHTVYEVPVTGGEITAKQQLNLTAGDWRVWLVGNSARDGDVIPRITTNVAHIIVAPTGGTEGSPFPAIPPTVEEQLRADMGNLADLTTEDKSSLVAAINEAAESGGSKDAVTYTPQTLTEEQKSQARTNIGAEKAGTAYTKPASGIPKTDLEQSVQTSLDKADTAILYNSQTLTTEQQKQARANIGVGQPDWNQNNETAPDYVKNRPFYTGDPVETVLLEETTATFADKGGAYTAIISADFSLEIGTTYKVSWDGTIYECVGIDPNGNGRVVILGNLSIMDSSFPDTGEPFLIFEDNPALIAGTKDTSASHTFSICVFAPEVVKIDPKYIRDMYYTGDPVETVLVEESTVTFAENNGLYMAEIRSSFEATVGETYKVSWDGAAYECTCVLIENLPAIGNLSFAGAGSDTGEPFLMAVKPGREIQIGTADTSASHTISISGLVSEVVKIDPKYLPDTIATKSEVEAAQTTAYDAWTKASNAQTTASNAQTTASNAQTTASNAQTTASNAQTTAKNAKSEALDLAARMFGHTSVVDSAFYHDKTLSITSLPACIESIGANAFNGCTNLALTSLPSGITSIGVNAFQGCKKLALTSLPSGLTSISDYAFIDCTNLALTSLPSGLTSIGGYAFDRCTNLALTSLPSGLTSIGDCAFADCTNLALTSLPSGLTSISARAFAGCPNLALTSLPSGLTSIGDHAFANCPNLALTSLPSGLTSIDDYAFSNCKNLALTSLPSGLTSISGYAFIDCINLALTSLPSGLTSIGGYAFQGCTGLTSITFTGKPTTINSAAFEGCTNLTTINVPWAEGEVANAPWGATNATINYNYTEA